MQTDNQYVPVAMVSSPGTVLRGAREERGETVSEVAFALKLSPRQIDALENDDFAALPGMALVRGFMRNYARYLGLDAAPLLEAVQRLAADEAPDLSPIRNADGQIPAGDARRGGSFPVGVVVALLIAALGVGWYFDWFSTGEAPQSVEVEPTFAPAPSQPVEPVSVMPPASSAVLAAQDDAADEQGAADAPAVEPSAEAAAEAAPGAGEAGSVTAEGEANTPAAGVPAAAADVPAAEVEPAAEERAAPAAESESPAAEPEPPAAAGQLGFSFAADSWVEVRDGSGNILHSGTNRAGSSRTVQGTPPFKLTVGNSASVKLEHDGKPVDLAAHTRGSVARLTLP